MLKPRRSLTIILTEAMQMTCSVSRRRVLTAIAAFGAFTTSANAKESERVRAVELTFLKSTPGNRDNLKEYIALNWFAMDRIAKDQGLMVAYTVLDTGTDEGPWNVLVSVTYRDEKGYEGIIDQFEQIRAAHKTVLVDGKTLRELGSIVESRKLYEKPSQGAR